MTLPYIAAITQPSWIRVLKTSGYQTEVNFWRPGRQGISAGLIGSYMILVRKGKSPRKIMGVGRIKGFIRMTIRDAWYRWGNQNGVSTLAEFVGAVTKVAESTSTNGGGFRSVIDSEESLIGCVILSDVCLFSEEQAPVVDSIFPSFPKNVVSYKRFPGTLPEPLLAHMQQSVSRMDLSESEDSPHYKVYSRSQGRFSISRSVWEGKLASGSPCELWITDQSGEGPERIYRLPSEFVDEGIVKKIGWQDGLRIYIQVSKNTDRILFVSNKNESRRSPRTDDHSIHIDGAQYRVPNDHLPEFDDVGSKRGRYPEAVANDDILAETPAPLGETPSTPPRTRSFHARHVEFEHLRREALELGAAGERLVFDLEKRNLERAGRADLARLVEHTAVVEGDGAGYDIRSFSINGQPKYIEVKTTAGGARTSFLMTANELDFAKEYVDLYWVYRVYDFRKSARYFKVSGKELLSLSCDPVQFRVRVPGTRKR